MQRKNIFYDYEKAFDMDNFNPDDHMRTEAHEHVLSIMIKECTLFHLLDKICNVSAMRRHQMALNMERIILGDITDTIIFEGKIN